MEKLTEEQLIEETKKRLIAGPPILISHAFAERLIMEGHDISKLNVHVASNIPTSVYRDRA